MASQEERIKKLDQVQEKLTELSLLKASSLARTKELSPDINFSDLVPDFEQMLDLIKQLQSRNISRLSTKQLNQIESALTHFENYVTKVKEFTLNQNTPGDVCESIIQEVKNGYDNILDPFIIPLAFTATQATDYSKIEREAKGYLSTMKEEADKLQKFITDSKQEAQKALNAVREQAAEAGVATTAQIFLQDSEKYGTLAGKWLKATIIVSSITLLVAIAVFILSYFYHPKTLIETIQYTVSKLILLSTLSFGIFWCAKNYKSQKHNETLNKHRANALMTFRAFVEGTDDIRVKDAVLLQASQAAFSARPTGFDSQENEQSTISPIVEILGKTLKSSPKSTE